MAEIKTSEFLDVNVTLNNRADIGSRYFGGADLDDHPFIKGYYQVFFELPSAIFGQEDIQSDAAKILTASVTSFTPPGDTTINTVDINGQGGVGASYASGQTIARDFSLTFNEKYQSPVWYIFKTWTSAIFDPYVGVSTVLAESGFVGKNYKGRCMVVETQPVKLGAETSTETIRKNIIKLYYFDGVFPTSDNFSQFDANNTDNTDVTLTVPFRYDGHPLTEKNSAALEKAVKYIQDSKLYETVTKYYKEVYKPNA